jgi:1-acyl-sn-glycerol-3-phosphate acyltransferase
LRAAKIVPAGVLFLVFWLCSPIVGWIIFPIVGLRSRQLSQAERMARYQWIASGGFGLFVRAMRWFRLIDFDPSQVRHATPRGPFVLVANHPTLIDVVILSSVYRNLCCVAKPALFRNPLVGRLLRYCGHIEAAPPGASPIAGATVIQRCIDRLNAGLPILIFPEGTRSPADLSGQLIGPMSRGAFEIAARAGVAIVPVFLACSPLALGRGMPWYVLPTRPVRFEITPLPVMHVDANPRETRAAAAHYHGLLASLAAEHLARSFASRALRRSEEPQMQGSGGSRPSLNIEPDVANEPRSA